MKDTPNALTAWAPGRINLIGEHTDYNEGFVMPAAIDMGMLFRLERNGTSGSVNARALDLGETWSFSLGSMAPLERGSWQNYIMGVAAEMRAAGGSLAGFDIEFGGNVPIGGGLSSSAALCCGLALALNELFALEFGKWELIRVAQLAEHHYAGTLCGVMDQFASMMGRQDKAVMLDCRSLEYQYYPIFAPEHDLLLLNSGVSHSLASSEYNLRRSECEEGTHVLKGKLPGICSLRDVSMLQLVESASMLPPRVYRRCRHVVSENLRVQQAAAALADGDFHRLGSLLYQSHDSLRNDYEVSCPELDLLVDLARGTAAVAGCRMMGGGFGGCTIQLIRKDGTEQFVESASRAYRERFGAYPEPILVSVSDGASVQAALDQAC